MNISPEVRFLLKNPIETMQYIKFLSARIKLKCINETDLFDYILLHDESPKIRIAVVRKNEQAAFQAINDSSKKVRQVIAETWESCAQYLVQDNSKRVRVTCTKWESCINDLLLSNCNQTIKAAALRLLGVVSENGK